ncbi:hypothetical protein TNIN_168721 [Trichonephila inaurata madagascariensis]|uniref:Uncharacterized protein n=1 Tax=Trichonephila inaurata madagascariensis TaxID=2747483 RepID=A0A8X6I5S2_9ARAC|nr:hypothetical protein TNIN_168721 [Trichonephila inaurata madagascariensis]
MRVVIILRRKTLKRCCSQARFGIFRFFRNKQVIRFRSRARGLESVVKREVCFRSWEGCWEMLSPVISISSAASLPQRAEVSEPNTTHVGDKRFLGAGVETNLSRSKTDFQ